MLFAGFLSLAFSSSAAAQAFTESIDVRVVNLEAVVTDRRGKPVRGLTAADFRLLVDGKEVPVNYFTEVVDGAAAARPAGGSSEGPAAALPAPVEGMVGRSVLVFLDRAFTIRAQLDFVLARVQEELDRLGPEDRVAVVSFDGRQFTVLTDWTDDRGMVRAVLERARKSPTDGLAVRAERASLANDESLRGTASEKGGVAGDRGPSSGAPGDAAGLDLLAGTVSPGGLQGPAQGAFGSLLVDDISNFPWKTAAKMQRTLTAGIAALRVFAGAPGRKVMLLLSGGWPVGLQPHLFPQLIDTANRLGYTLYPVDVAGLEASPVPIGAEMLGPTEPGLPNLGMISSPWEQESKYGMEQIARWTGGKASLNSNRLAALDRLVADTASYYWLGFSPDWRGDGRRHAVRLEARRPGLRVRSRRSFTDLSPAAESAMSIAGQLLLGRAVQEKGLTVTLGKARSAGLREIEVPLSLGIPAAALTFVALGDAYQAELPLHAVSFDSSQEPLDLPPTVLRVVVRTVPPAGEQMHFESTLRIRRGERKLRLTVQDAIHDKLLWGEGEIGR
jgi:VWFA-related protein